MKAWKRFMALCVAEMACIGFANVCLAQEPSQLPSHQPPLLVDPPGQGHDNAGNSTTVVTSTFDAARLDASMRTPNAVIEPPLSFDRLDALKNDLRKAVFVVHTTQAPSHTLAAAGVSFDGACVALVSCPQGLEDGVVAEESARDQEANPSSFFGRDLERYSSPFAERPPQNSAATGAATCYLTTADWLTNVATIQIMINDRPVSAQVVKRDEAQNVAILRTSFQASVRGRTVAPFDAPQSPVAYVLLEPGKMYESFTQQSFVIELPHLYGKTSLLARNGYPLFNAKGEIVGLTVSPIPDRTKAHVVHYMLIDRVLYPEKYDRTIHEETELIQY